MCSVCLVGRSCMWTVIARGRSSVFWYTTYSQSHSHAPYTPYGCVWCGRSGVVVLVRFWVCLTRAGGPSLLLGTHHHVCCSPYTISLSACALVSQGWCRSFVDGLHTPRGTSIAFGTSYAYTRHLMGRLLYATPPISLTLLVWLVRWWCRAFVCRCVGFVG